MFVEKFPATRLRRLRQSAWIRDIVQETQVRSSDLIQPVFVIAGKNKSEAIPGLPGMSRLSVDLAAEYAERIYQAGIRCIFLVPCLDNEKKTMDGREALNESGLLAQAVAAIKTKCPALGIMGDVALDLYTAHGHDGVVDEGTGEIKNDETVEMLVKQSLAQANMGIDMLAPSDMMDGRVGAIREALEGAGHSNTMIVPHSVKYASALYGPYRDAVGSAKNLGKGSKETYQQNPANVEEALRETRLDLTEGADAAIVKPGTLYLDVIYRIKQAFQIPIIAYHVSGEYAMLKTASAAGLIDEKRAFIETMTAFKRAGCAAVVTYGALDMAELIQGYGA